MTPAVLVTGASSGLGRAVAHELARRGGTVVLLARDGARLQATADEVERLGAEARAVAADVTDTALDGALARALSGLDLGTVVHCAGLIVLAPLERLDEDDLRRCLDVNVVGTSRVVRACLPHLERTRGRIALAASVQSQFPIPGGFSAYAASKWALRGWAEAIRPELAERGISLTVAYPSILDTPMVRELGTDAPDVYRAFRWHPAEVAARSLVRDLDRGRRESYVTLGDRLGCAVARAFPHAFAAGFSAVVRRRARASRESAP